MNKAEVLATVRTKILEKVQNLEHLIAETRASNNDTKSSMGDKYETGREMLQQEINNLQRQLNEILHQQSLMQKLSSEPCTKVQNGALIKTDKGLFYISASVGEIVWDSNHIMTISGEAPLAKAMMGMKPGQTFSVNSTHQIIKEIW
ncbi:transcription elongation GreA/GreB family factor [Chryseobacterium defluvii]|uniref:Transcription elongation GreA/GreB family factor n=1 Tax=Chryseobacterium defluvii TaxID=160396 RepID=A0A840KGM6_9FLAO|nr:hypothetical protein [Chryseobacterium defluvii]MBB4806072.1 transcription elongation GreA/GreB family factor [Chryseobacterium defluvii]